MTVPRRDHVGRPVPEPAWWLADPELWSLLAFEGGHDDDGLPVDLAWKDRQQVLDDLIRLPDLADIEFARFLLVQETHMHGHIWGFNHSIERAAILLAEHRRVQDVWLLWEAVYRSFDTWGIMPHRIVYAAGVEPVLRYVADSDHPQRDHLLEYLHRLDGTTDEQVARLLADRRCHYRELERH